MERAISFFLVSTLLLTFFDPEFSRDRVVIFRNDYVSGIREQWINHTNLTPFKTIQSMWMVRDYDGYVGQFATLNLLGNVIAFMPAAFFLPLLKQRFRRFLPFALTLAGVIISVELLQFFTLTGSMDIDDFILNYTGVMLLYVLLYCTPLRKHILHFYTKL